MYTRRDYVSSGGETVQLEPSAKDVGRQLLAEFAGTMFIVWGSILTCTSIGRFGHVTGSHLPLVILQVALATGLLVTVFVHALSPVSGAHFNPAVTFGAMLTKSMSPRIGLLYIISQFLGGIVGAAIARIIDYEGTSNLVYGKYGTFLLVPGMDAWRAFLLEVLLAFILVHVYFGTVLRPLHRKYTQIVETTVPGERTPITGGTAVVETPAAVDFNVPSTWFVALPIGFTYVALTCVAGLITGACLNPARALGPAIIAGYWSFSWIWILAPFVGGALSALFWKYAVAYQTYEHETTRVSIQ